MIGCRENALLPINHARAKLAGPMSGLFFVLPISIVAEGHEQQGWLICGEETNEEPHKGNFLSFRGDQEPLRHSRFPNKGKLVTLIAIPVLCNRPVRTMPGLRPT